MNAKLDIQEKEVAELDIGLLTEALNALQELAWAVDGDIYTDAPECQVSINQAQEAIQHAYDILERITKVRLKVYEAHAAEQAEALARRILEEAEEAFAGKSMAEERALLGNWSRPESVSDYLFWIEDEAQLQQAIAEAQTDDGNDQRSYIQALLGLAEELRDLGFIPSLAPWEMNRQTVQS